MDNFDFKKYLAEGILLKEGNFYIELEDDIKDFVASIEDDNYQRSKDNDPDYEEVKPTVKFFKDLYPQYDRVPDEMIEPFLKEGEGKIEEEKHGVIPNLDRYIELTDPSIDLTDEEFSELESIEDQAKQNGTLGNLERAAKISHFGRQNFQANDPLDRRQKDIKSKTNRITKGGMLNKNSATGLKNMIKLDRS
jgi:hypothetical protein